MDADKIFFRKYIGKNPKEVKMEITKKQVAKMIDNSLLAPNATEDEVAKFCEESVKYDFAAVYVLPAYLPLAVKILSGTDVKVGAPVGFPLGGNTIETKVFETKDAIEKGAQEVDMVVNIGALKSGNYDYLKKEIDSFVNAAKSLQKDVLTKVIIETGFLTDEEKVKIAKLIKETGADFIKTCTGFNPGRATIHDIKLIRKAVGENMGIKASGGAVSTIEDAMALIEAGATRIGTKAGIEIIKSMEIRG